jgi:ABC-type transport system involved in multi-copper enzyme maturation permease subunit
MENEDLGQSVNRSTDQPTDALARQVVSRSWRFASRMWTNPIVIKELRGRMRGWRAAAVLTVHLVILGCFASLIYFTVAESASSTGSGTVGKTMGQTLFYSTYMLLLTVVVFLSPAFTAGTISGERERKTFDLLITTLLPARSVVIGKLISALAYIVLLILAALPIQSLALMFGGITLPEVIIGTLILLITALVAGAIGIFVSSVMRSSIASTVLTYATILLSAIGFPIVMGIIIGFLGAILEPALEDLDWVWQAALIYIGGFLLCTNPFATAITTKLIEDAENSLIFFTAQVTDQNGISHTIPLISPWIVYVLFYIVVSGLLILSSILIIRRKRG